MATNGTTKKSSTPPLPFELIVEIFLRLPSKSLQRLRFILDDDLSDCLKTFAFQQKHALNVLNNPTNEQILVLNDSNIIIRSIDPHGSNSSSTLGKNPSIMQHYNLTQVFKDIFPNIKEYVATFNYFSLIGASNGLICLYFTSYCVASRLEYDERTKHFILWNPCTGEHHVLPTPPEHEPVSHIIGGFGYDTANKTYKLVIIRDFVTQLYDLSTNVWKIVDEIRINTHGCYLDRFGSDQFGQSLNDALHWTVSWEEIVSIDLSTEVSTRLKLPQCCSNTVENRPNVGVLKGCLSVLCYQIRSGDLSVWVMKEYGSDESWAYISTINLWREEIGFWPSRKLYRPRYLWVSQDDKMLFLIDGKLAFFSKDEKFCHFMHAGFNENSRGVVHVDTLVSPKPEVYRLGYNGDGKTRVLK